MASISDTSGSDAGSLIQRLVVDRLAVPGVLDRRQLHGTYDRLTRPPTRHSPPGLSLGIEAPSPSAPGLPFARTAQPSEHSMISAAEGESVVRAPAIGGAGIGSFGAASGAGGVGIGGAASSTGGVGVGGASSGTGGVGVGGASSGTGGVGIGGVASGTGGVNTVGAGRIGAGGSSRAPSATAPLVSPALSSATASAGPSSVAASARMSASTVARSVSASAVARGPSSSSSVSTSTSITPATPGHNRVMRKAVSAAPLVRVPESRPSDAVSASPLAGPAPLVYRKPEAPTVPSPASLLNTAKQHSTLTAAAPNVIAHTAAARWERKHSGHSEAYEEAPKLIEPRLEQIIGRVERHLARQLEIESDRQGVRQWR